MCSKASQIEVFFNGTCLRAASCQGLLPGPTIRRTISSAQHYGSQETSKSEWIFFMKLLQTNLKIENKKIEFYKKTQSGYIIPIHIFQYYSLLLNKEINSIHSIMNLLRF